MFEALRAELPAAGLVAPRGTRASLQVVLDQDVLAQTAANCDGSVVLWLDDLEGFVRTTGSGIDAPLYDELVGTIPGLVVAATTGGRGVETQAVEGQEFDEPLRALTREGVTEQLSTALGSEAERRALAAVVPAALATAMEAGIGSIAVSGDALIDMLVTGRNRRFEDGTPCLEGAALAQAVIAAYRLGVVEPLPRDLLLRLFGCYTMTPTDTRLRRAIDWATTPLYGDIAVLRGDGRELAPFDYLVQHDKQRDAAAERRVWSELLANGRPSDAFWLGIGAMKREATDDAIEAFGRADDKEDARGANNLGYLLERRGDVVKAKAAYSRADARGHPLGATNYGYLLKQGGDLDGAEAVYRRAEDRGDGAGVYDLGVLLAERGDLDDAKNAWRRAAKLGGVGGGCAAYTLGERCVRDRDTTGAEPWMVRADELGDMRGTATLGVFFEQRGDRAKARELYERAAATDGDGGALGARFLGLLLKDDGDLLGSEIAYARADELGDARGAFNLGVLRRDRGDLVGAVEAYQRAVERGDPDAQSHLDALAAAARAAQAHSAGPG